QATIETMKEVSGPVIATALSLTAVFVPVAAMSGITGRLYQQFAITIAISVCISAVVALSLSPALSSTLLKPHEHGARKGWLGRFFARFNRALDKVTDRYIDLTARFTHRPLRALLVLGALVVALLLLFRAVPGGFVPEEDQAYLMANLQLPDAAS